MRAMADSAERNTITTMSSIIVKPACFERFFFTTSIVANPRAVIIVATGG